MRINIKKHSRIILVVLVLLVIQSFVVMDTAQAFSEDTDINLYIFWGQGCPHCAQAIPVLTEIAENNPRIGFYDFEVYAHQENIDLFYNVGEALGFTPQYVPTIIAGDKYWVGYSEDIRVEIETYISGCLVNGCPDPVGDILAGQSNPQENTPENTPQITTLTPEASPSPTDQPMDTPVPTVTATHEAQDETISLPLIGKIDLSNQSVFLSTVLISLVDGFNPCSIWVLSMLLAITLNTRSRKKVLMIGFVFIFVTGLVYALFIAGLFTVLRVVSFMGWIQVIVAVVALIFGLINIKDYFWFKEGISLTISDKKKPGIYKGIRRVLHADNSIWALIAGTVVLAAGVSLVEFSCTAGFPVLWTNLLTSQDVSGFAFLGYLLVYMFIYQVDELGIFLASVFTLRKSKFEEKHGRILKLVGGMLMLTLAAVMIIDPTIMNEITNTLWVFGTAFGLTALVLLVHRVILPKFNIQIGSE